MCRNIRVLHHFEPPSTPEEVQAAALQYVRKVSGLARPSKADTRAFDAAVRAIARSTTALLEKLNEPTAPPRTREGERDRAKVRWQRREAQLAKRLSSRA